MRYNPALDGLRAIAVLMVIEYHGEWHWLGWIGHLGVDVFFVLSGFLITSILLKEQATGGIRLGAFYLRRARRLVPALVLLVAILLATGVITFRGAITPLLYMGDYFPTPGALAHTWSLAVEEHYYLLWPLALPLLARMDRKRAIVLLALAYAIAVAWSQLSPWEWRADHRFDMRLSGLVCGSLLAFLPRTSLLPFAGMVAAYLALAIGHGSNRVFAEATTACVIVLSSQMTLPFLTRAPLVYVGRISYGVYLAHWPLQLALDGWFAGWQLLLVTIAASIACASLSFHTVEAYFRTPRPVLRSSGIPAGNVSPG